jgi:hypothetical protein
MDGKVMYAEYQKPVRIISREGEIQKKVSSAGTSVDPNDLIDTIVDAIDYVEIAKDLQGLVKARRLLNNDLRQAIDSYVQVQLNKARQTGQPGFKEQLVRQGTP